ncbi:hypothetical protein LCGC14_3117770, partial [marine sediment metagenome]
RRTVHFRLNGTTAIGYDEVGSPPDATARPGHSLSTIYDLAVDDYVEFMVSHTQGLALDITADSNHSPEFMMSRIGAAGTSGGGAPGTDHGSLTGLGDDDHSLYLLAAGSRAGSTGGAQDFGSNGIKTDLLVESTSGAGILIDGAQAAAVQLTVQGAASQSTNIFTVEISSGADKLVVDSDGDVLMKEHVAIGPSATINASRVLNLVEQKADSNLIGAFINPINSSSSGMSRNTTGLSGIAEWKGSGTATGNNCIGLDFIARHNSTRALTNLVGLQAGLVALSGGTGAITNAIGININTSVWTGDEPAIVKGINIENLGSAAFDGDSFGINIDAPVTDGSSQL